MSNQVSTGNLYGTVTDIQGQPLPGVTMTLKGQIAPKVQVTNAQGHFQFLNLAPATYSLMAELEGFSPYEQSLINIAVGRNTTIEMVLQPSEEENRPS